MKVALVAIVKDEHEYMLEWLAYHRAIIGIDGVIVADNVSSDGTSQLLEALDMAGYINRVHYPRLSPDAGPQIPAYNDIVNRFGSDYDYFLFIDADEFLVNNKAMPIQEILSQYESHADFGALVLNWRIFGSAGNTFKRNGLVTERFYRASRKQEGVNRHTKVLAKSNLIDQIHIHHVQLKTGFVCYDESGLPAVFLRRPSSADICEQGESTPFTKTIMNSGLYIAHFAVKSKAEHFFKKAKRGSAGGKSSHEKGERYFSGHDLNHEECKDLYEHLPAIKGEIASIYSRLNELTPYTSYLRCHVDQTDSVFAGWVATDFDGTVSLKVLLDGVYEKELPLNTVRTDVFSKDISNTELCGFRYAWKEIGDYKKSVAIWVKGGNLVVFEKTI